MLLQSSPPPAPLVSPPHTTLVLHTILMYGVPNFNIGGGCEPFLGISQRNKSIYASKPLKIKKGTEIVEFDCGGTILSRDVKIQFFNKTSKVHLSLLFLFLFLFLFLCI
jgi:C2 domain of PTEN tumour-suppressor protein